MKNSLTGLYNRIINKGSERTVKVKNNIVKMTLYKGISIIVSLVLVPLTLDYVDSSTYGIWLTLSSIVAWISFFDIGLNNGLKNRLAESIANNNEELGRKYVSTTYAVLALIFIPLMVILLAIVPHLDWNSLLKLDGVDNYGIVVAISIIIAYFCINFILSTITVVITAHQEPANAAMIGMLQQVFSLIVIYLLTIITKGSLVKLCLGLCAAPLVIMVMSNIFLFRGRYKHLSPSFKCVDFKKVPDLMKLGIKFFIIQIAGIIQFQMVNFLIIRNYGAEDVTSYNIAYKYYNALYMVWGILLTPLWVAVTDAATRGDYTWIQNAKKKYLKLFGLFTVISIVMFVFSGFVYRIWVGDKVPVSAALSFWVMLYFLVTMFGSTYVFILNGLNELNVQTIACCISPFVFLGVFELLVDQGVGVYSVLIGSILSNFNGFILAPIQTHIILGKRLS